MRIGPIELRFKRKKKGESYGRGSLSNPIEVTKDKNDIGAGLGRHYLPRRSREYHTVDLTQYANTWDADRLLDILIDSNPDISFALYSFLRMCNSGFHYKVVKKNGSIYKEAQAVLDTWIRELNLQPGSRNFREDYSINSFVNKIHLSFFVKGAAAVEVPLTASRKPAYLKNVNPSTIHFKRENSQLVPYQYQSVQHIERSNVWDGNYRKIDIPSFFYQPFDARLDDVYGVCPILPALQIIFFQQQVLQDLQVAVHKVGHPRISIKLLEEILIKNAPSNIRNNRKELQAWLTDRKKEIENEYKNIKPDDAIVSFDSVNVGLVETQRGMGGYDADALLRVIDAQLIASVKSLSTLMGRYRGRTETYASAEVQLYIKGIEAIQKISSLLMGRILTFCLQMFGYQGYVEWGYNETHLRSKLETANFQAVNIRNHLIWTALGFQTLDEMCVEILGKKPSGTVLTDDIGPLVLALLQVKYPGASVQESSGGNGNGNGKESFHTVDELIAKINGNR